MLPSDQINEIHRLAGGEHWSMRSIARHLHLTARTVKKYLQSPAALPARRQRASMLDLFKPLIAELLEQDPRAPGTVILQRLQAAGYSGHYTILREYLQRRRAARSTPRAFVRMEPPPGERFEIDWGHFGTLDYQGDKRKLYAFCLIEGHSRMLYVEFTHCQSFETFVRCHQHAFAAMQGVARECWYDNLLTAVAEHDGPLIRFQPRFLAFAREYSFYPRACHRAAGWEKGKVERGGVRYVRQNFWLLRQFTDLTDVNRQVRPWLHEIANSRVHRETRQRPCDRFRPDCLRPLPTLAPDYRDTAEVFIHKDLRWHFDANHYCAPARWVGQHLTAKADSSSVTLYDHGGGEIVRYARSFRRGQTFGAERFEKELLAQRPATRRSRAQQCLLALLRGLCSPETVACQKYACPKGCTVVTAEKPEAPIEKGAPGPGLLAQVAVSKYGDHLPLNRQEEIFRRQGVELPRQTICDWMQRCAELVYPLYEMMKKQVLGSKAVQTDDTPVPVLDPELPRTRTGRTHFSGSSVGTFRRMRTRDPTIFTRIASAGLRRSHAGRIPDASTMRHNPPT